MQADGFVPFVDVSLTLAMSASSTGILDAVDSGTHAMIATDARLGVRVGWEIVERFLPYVAGRGFGGPVLWHLDGKDVTGSDVRHYQVAAGLAVLLPGAASLFIDGSFLGEKSLSAGVSFRL